MAQAVVDSSAVLALLLKESGHERVAPLMGDALLSGVNAQEIFKAMRPHGFTIDQIKSLLLQLELEIVPHGLEEAAQAAGLIEATRSFGSGIGDRSCLALGIARKLPVYTADRAWANIKTEGLEVVVIR